MINPETKNPHTAHTTNPVPFIMTTDPDEHCFVEDDEDQEEGALCDVAPTVLALMVSDLLFLTFTQKVGHDIDALACIFAGP